MLLKISGKCVFHWLSIFTSPLYPESRASIFKNNNSFQVHLIIRKSIINQLLATYNLYYIRRSALMAYSLNTSLTKIYLIYFVLNFIDAWVHFRFIRTLFVLRESIWSHVIIFRHNLFYLKSIHITVFIRRLTYHSYPLISHAWKF